MTSDPQILGSTVAAVLMEAYIGIHVPRERAVSSWTCFILEPVMLLEAFPMHLSFINAQT